MFEFTFDRARIRSASLLFIWSKAIFTGRQWSLQPIDRKNNKSESQLLVTVNYTTVCQVIKCQLQVLAIWVLIQKFRDPGPFYSPVKPGIGKVKPGIGNYMKITWKYTILKTIMCFLAVCQRFITCYCKSN